MVNMVHQAWADNNFGSPGTSAQFGPYGTASSIVRLVRIRATFALTGPGVDLAPTAQIRDQVCWGVQAGSPGYTPEVLPGDIGGVNFWWSELLAGPTADGAAWSPPTADVGWMVTRVATNEWRGQFPIGEGADFYVTAGAIAAGAADFAAGITLEVDYSS